ncbi:MAG TPA: amino acid adenylation domain-containing protein [Streptosporangiaceae bacterium]|nr:amino acid adenylation domain-containing protein [Streptosporangiaceae bacterium]
MLLRTSSCSGPCAPIPHDSSCHGVVLERAAQSPQATAIRARGGSTTYQELVAKAQAVHDMLRQRGIGPGSYVPILTTQPGEPFVVASIGVLLAGAAYAAADPRWPKARLQGTFADLNARVALDLAGHGIVAGLDVLSLPSGRCAVAQPPAAVTADAPACVFFTSGSMGGPKGIVIPHRALVRTFVDCGYADFGPDTVMPMLAAPHWDGGALEVFGPLCNGGCVVEAESGLLTPAELRRLVREEGVNTLWLTSSLASLLIDEGLDAFAGIRHLMTGGERVSPRHLARFLAAYPGARLSNGYGPAESTVFVATHDVTQADVDRAAPGGIPVGTSVRNTRLAIMDADGKPVGVGQVGELWVAGDGLALGYLNRPEETARCFGTADLPGVGVVRVYRTGDLLRMMASGVLEFVGRADRQFKLRGHRIEPEEVERTVRAADEVADAFLLPVAGPDGAVSGTVCAYTTESGRPLPERYLRDRTGALLAAYLRPDRFLHLSAVPLGPNGKADLHALGRMAAAATAKQPGQTAREGSPALGEAQTILGQPGLTENDDLVAHGADSLQILRIAARFARLLSARLSAADVYRQGTVAGLVRLAAERPAPADPAPSADAAALSPGERRFWIAERLAPGAPGHVAISRVDVRGPLDPARLDRALAAVAAAHPGLRTVFPAVRGRPHRQVMPVPALPPVICRRAARHDSPAELHALTAQLAAAVHDLDRGPLVAGGLLSAGPDRHTLVTAFHHIVFDAHSERVLLGDLAVAWADGVPEPAPAAPTGPPPDADRLAEFWRSELAGLEPLALPGANWASQSELWAAPMSAYPVTLPTGTWARLRAAAAGQRCPALAIILAAWWRALARWTGKLDFAIGIMVQDRQATHEHTIGFLANGLPLRPRGTLDASGSELVASIRESLLAALAHAALPTDQIATLAPRPPDGRSPLYQNMMLLQQVSPPVRLGDAELSPRPAPPLGPQAELVCELWANGDDLDGHLQAPQGLFAPDALAFLHDLLDTEFSALLGKGPA